MLIQELGCFYKITACTSVHRCAAPDIALGLGSWHRSTSPIRGVVFLARLYRFHPWNRTSGSCPRTTYVHVGLNGFLKYLG